MYDLSTVDYLIGGFCLSLVVIIAFVKIAHGIRNFRSKAVIDNKPSSTFATTTSSNSETTSNSNCSTTTVSPPQLLREGLSDQYMGVGGESCKWVNDLLNWCYLHYNLRPYFLEAWIDALNDTSSKLSQAKAGVNVCFENFTPGSLPPNVTQIKTEPGPLDSLTIHVLLESTELGFVLVATEPKGDKILSTRFILHVHRLKTQAILQLRIQMLSSNAAELIELNIKLVGNPQLKFDLKPQHPNQEFFGPEAMIFAERFNEISEEEVERMVSKVILSSVVTLKYSKAAWLTSPLNLALSLPEGAATAPGGAIQTDGGAEVTEDMMTASQTCQLASAAPSGGTTILGSKLPQRDSSVTSKRLLVRVIRASSLGHGEFGMMEPFCMLTLDVPFQIHNTSPVKNSANPYWDEQFLFKLTALSKELKVEVFDRGRPQGDDLLGVTSLLIQDILTQTSTRRTLPIALAEHTDLTTAQMSLEVCMQTNSSHSVCPEWLAANK